MKVTNPSTHRTRASRSRHAFTLAIVTALCAGSICAAAQAASSSVVSVAHATRLDSGDAVVGALPTNQRIHIEVALKLRNKAALDQFVANIGKSAAQHQRPQLMSSAQFLADHAPTQAQAQKVVDYLARAGYSNIRVAPNHLLVSADGTAASARAAFTTNFAQVRTYDGRIAYVNTDEARVPSALTDTILAVVGLQNVHQFHASSQPLSSGLKPLGSVLPQAVVIHEAMDYPWIYGATAAVANQVPVGILTDGDLTQVQSALNTYASDNGMKPIVQSIVNTNGSSTDGGNSSQWLGASVVIAAMINGGPNANTGPATSLIFYNIPSLSDADVTADLNTIVAANQSKIIEATISKCETDAQTDGTAAAQDAILQAGFAQGQTFAIPVGDAGHFQCSAPYLSWPSSSQYVTAVAGTNLNTANTDRLKYNFESVYQESLGKPSAFEAMPAWQSAFGVPGTTRGVPDVAFAAMDGAAFNGIGGGTCCTNQSAALFTGVWARILSAWGVTSGPASPILYALPAADFHDITATGQNGDGESPGPGYDFATGRGSMIISKAITDAGPLVNKPPTASFKISQPGPLTLHFKDLSADSDGTIVAHHWDFGDGATSTGTFPNHTYAASGTYTIVETVTDNDGATDQDSQTASTFKQVVMNPSFETGTFSPWNFSVSGTGHGLVTLDGTSADAFDGSWSADITYGGGTYLYQTVTIPTGKTSATLTVHLWVQDNEPPFHSNDLNIQLRQPGGGGISQDTVLTTLGTFTNLDASSGYVTHTFDVTPYIGQKVIVTFQGVKHPDGNPVSGQFVVDDVTLTAQ